MRSSSSSVGTFLINVSEILNTLHWVSNFTTLDPRLLTRGFHRATTEYSIERMKYIILIFNANWAGHGQPCRSNLFFLIYYFFLASLLFLVLSLVGVITEHGSCKCSTGHQCECDLTPWSSRCQWPTNIQTFRFLYYNFMLIFSLNKFKSC